MDATTSVWLSGALRATCSVATLPAALVRFTTTTGWPSPAVMPWATTRAVVSVLPPGQWLRTGYGRGNQGHRREQSGKRLRRSIGCFLHAGVGRPCDRP
jgi:hypothetical protein